MTPKFRFSLRAFLLFAALLGVEVLIALFVRDGWIRGFLGDVLVVAVLFYLLRSFVPVKPLPLALGVFLFACAVEVAQAFDFVTRLGFEDNRLVRTALGSTFDVLDLPAYALGALLVGWISTGPAASPVVKRP
jgi:hypothetical protein